MRAERRLDLVPAFVKLLQDGEAEVRVAAAAKVSAFCKILNHEAVISALLPAVKELSTDSSQCAATPLVPPQLQALAAQATSFLRIYRF